MNREIRFGSRESALAIAQAHLVMDPIARAHPELSLRLITMKTHGDLHPELPLGQAEAGAVSPGKAFFTDALEQALEEGKIDLCVHSLKDMAEKLPEGLPIAAFLKRGDPRDMLVLPKGRIFEDLGTSTKLRSSEGSPLERLGSALPVGSSSLRRRLQFRLLAPGIRVAPIRGNVPTRLSKMDAGQYGALLLAAAGLERLGIRDRRTHVFSVEEMIPAAGQGTLAVQGRRGEDYRFLDTIRDPVTEAESGAERAFIRTLNCGCGAPAAVYATILGSEIHLIALYAANAESPLFRDEISGDREAGLRLAEELARRLLQKGQGR